MSSLIKTTSIISYYLSLVKIPNQQPEALPETIRQGLSLDGHSTIRFIVVHMFQSIPLQICDGSVCRLGNEEETRRATRVPQWYTSTFNRQNRTNQLLEPEAGGFH